MNRSSKPVVPQGCPTTIPRRIIAPRPSSKVFFAVTGRRSIKTSFEAGWEPSTAKLSQRFVKNKSPQPEVDLRPHQVYE